MAPRPAGVEDLFARHLGTQAEPAGRLCSAISSRWQLRSMGSPISSFAVVRLVSDPHG